MTKNSLDHNGFEQESLGAQVKFNKALASQRLAWGLEYEHTDNERTRFKGPTVPGDFVGYNELSFPPPPASAVRSGPLTRSSSASVGC